ncbi:MAG: type IV pili twitching motility protein PilT [Deltaproteobacteria bacterium]|nr:MAG: type IV pili twitching motility protein PilT [Deltaproteobacteria bacterium]
METAIFEKVLTLAHQSKASDVHFKVGAPIMLRINGELLETKSPILSAEDTISIANSVLTNAYPPVNVEQLRQWDGSYSVTGVSRFRVNIYRQRNTIALIMRAVPFEIPTFESLRLPDVLKKISMESRGLILVTGVTGSGKSSTLAAMVNHINNNRKCHILTIEDPLEFMHKNIRSSISQREIGLDTENFSLALRSALRQDPDIILVGEMRDHETIDTALRAAETGHLVLSTAHTTDAQSTINRLISVFPSDKQATTRLRLAESLVATVSQRLIPVKEGKGRVPACEIMRMTKTVEEYIKDPLKTFQLKDVIEQGHDSYSSQSFDQHLMWLFKDGVISYDTAHAAATHPSDFERQVLLDTGGDMPD